jgi:hypothetical protein
MTNSVLRGKGISSILVGLLSFSLTIIFKDSGVFIGQGLADELVYAIMR